MILRERGIYRLPNGRELVVLRNGDEGSVLYGPVSCERFEMGEFLVNQAGRLLYQGKLTGWDISNLSDTGRTSLDILGSLKVSLPQSEINGDA
jgi:hypothetical protein